MWHPTKTADFETPRNPGQSIEGRRFSGATRMMHEVPNRHCSCSEDLRQVQFHAIRGPRCHTAAEEVGVFGPDRAAQREGGRQDGPVVFIAPAASPNPPAR